VQGRELRQQAQHRGAVTRRERREQAFLHAADRGFDLAQQPRAVARQAHELDAAVGRARFAPDPALRLEPFEHVADRRAVEGDQGR